MTQLEKSWHQEDRSVGNLLNFGLAVCPTTLLVKDHKTFDLGTAPPTRFVMRGNVGANKPLSEYMSLILEPVAKRQESMEINASSGLLSVIESLNADLSTHTDEDQIDDTTGNIRSDKKTILETIDEEMKINFPPQGNQIIRFRRNPATWKRRVHSLPRL